MSCSGSNNAKNKGRDRKRCKKDANLDQELIDGILVDENYNPTSYHLLRNHPGGQYWNQPGINTEGAPALTAMALLVPEKPQVVNVSGQNVVWLGFIATARVTITPLENQ